MRREREAKEVRRKAEAATTAAAIWKAAQPAPDDHPYLTWKGIKAHGARLHNGAVLIPIREGANLHSLQFIDGDGEKRFLTGGRGRMLLRHRQSEGRDGPLDRVQGRTSMTRLSAPYQLAKGHRS